MRYKMVVPVLIQAGLPALIKGLAEGLKAVNTPLAQGASLFITLCEMPPIPRDKK
jgi:hypothetical protein